MAVADRGVIEAAGAEGEEVYIEKRGVRGVVREEEGRERRWLRMAVCERGWNVCVRVMTCVCASAISCAWWRLDEEKGVRRFHEYMYYKSIVMASSKRGAEEEGWLSGWSRTGSC